jgi:uncharacterized membrane protein YfcA
VLSAGFNLVSANAVKNLMVLVFTAAALIRVHRSRSVNWTLGLLLAAGQSLGAWIAAADGREARRAASCAGW